MKQAFDQSTSNLFQLEQSTKIHNYIVEERKINSTLSKVGVPYFGTEEPISITVADKHLKLENPVRFNVNQSLKERIIELEQTI
ncbi:UNVERIFIED_CONTAM: hypothetical protein HDU68_005043, partial [Siphonaria sp. JEL0065]